MRIQDIFATDDKIQSVWAVVRVERCRVLALDENHNYNEDPCAAAGYVVREDAYHDARATRGLIVYVKRGERVPASGWGDFAGGENADGELSRRSVESCEPRGTSSTGGGAHYTD